MPVHTVLAVLDELPVSRALVEHLIPLPDDVRRWIFVACADDQKDRVTAALAGIPAVDPFVEETEAPGDARTLDEVRALAWTLRTILEAAVEGPFVTEESYLDLSVRALATPDRALVRARLVDAGLTVADAASLAADRAPIDDAAAIAQAIAPFEKHFSPEVAPALRAFLEGPGGPVPAILTEAKSAYYDERRCAFIRSALTGAVERWNPRTSGKLLDLWMVLRRPLETDMSLGLGEDDLPAELGVDRARHIAAVLEARGLAPALAAVAARSCTGASTWFLAPTFLAHPEIFAAALAVDRGVARKLADQAVPRMGLEMSPSVRARVLAFLESHSEALGVEALLSLADKYAEHIDEAHLVNAAIGGDPTEVCKLAAKLEQAEPKRHAGAKRRANERWISAADPVLFATTLRRVVERAEEGLDADVAWMRLIDLIAANPDNPFGDAPDGPTRGWDFFVLDPLPKPGGEAKARLVALCEKLGKALGHLLKDLEKKAGIKRKTPPSPHAEADLAGLPPAWAKAWKTARDRSWKEGYRLPASAGEEALAAAEKALGAPLPGDVRSFYALHDGAGEDECFRGCRLYGIQEAVEKRTWLLTIDGAPFDAAWLPVTDDGGGNHSCVVLTGPKAGTVIDFDHETGGGRAIAKSFAAFVQSASWE
jgi:cell wall assembly regulator SMI1